MPAEGAGAEFAVCEVSLSLAAAGELAFDIVRTTGL